MNTLYEKKINTIENSYVFQEIIGIYNHVESLIQLLSIMLYSVIMLLTEGVAYDNHFSKTADRG